MQPIFLNFLRKAVRVRGGGKWTRCSQPAAWAFGAGEGAAALGVLAVGDASLLAGDSFFGEPFSDLAAAW